ncbi:hypothetical protein DPMN_054319 [Dreissena polymorpha]|uniref:Uncharacterized protein n=2 Tax=Dreissena polymorpha TaxID=45954 RepID=A0A9D4HRI6_DREPO|nr:hypothetical protein DPMN_054319 [Dreissena polymorpha]
MILSLAANELETQSLKAFCQPAGIDASQAFPKPKLIAFKVPQKVLDILESIARLEKSYVFERMWKAVCNKNGHLCKTLPDVVDAVWKHVENG